MRRLLLRNAAHAAYACSELAAMMMRGRRSTRSLIGRDDWLFPRARPLRTLQQWRMKSPKTTYPWFMLKVFACAYSQTALFLFGGDIEWTVSNILLYTHRLPLEKCQALGNYFYRWRWYFEMLLFTIYSRYHGDIIIERFVSSCPRLVMYARLDYFPLPRW